MDEKPLIALDRATAQIEGNGYWLEAGAIPTEFLNELRVVVDRTFESQWQKRADGTPFAIRNAHLKLHGLLGILERAGVVAMAADLLQATPQPVSAVVFDKPEGAKWSVPAHQDAIHPLVGVGPVAGFENWSEKDGLRYAKFPEKLLDSMLALRIHCDDCTAAGALQVVPGSHRGLRPSGEAMSISQAEFVRCPGEAGSILAMKPMLVHRSGPAGEGERRRVLHVVFSGQALPGGMSWTWS